MAKSRMDWLIDLLGGEQNLPPKLPPAPPPKEPKPIEADHIYQSEEYISLPHPNTPVQYGIPLPRQPHPKHSAAPTPSREGIFVLPPESGTPAPRGINLVPFLAVKNYCYKFVPKQWSQPLATDFFDQGKIFTRNWSLYYVASDYGGVVTFVTETELQALLDDINNRFPAAKLEIEQWHRNHNGFFTDFNDLPQPLRPRFAGFLASKAQFDSWMFQLDRMGLTHIPMVPNNGDRSLEAFKEKINAAIELGKNKSKGKRAKAHQETMVKRRDMVRGNIRGQQYFGLAPKDYGEYSQMSDISSLSISPIDVEMPVPYTFQQEPIFIAFDVEAYERYPHDITEVGVATLDTRDLKNIPPGGNAVNWRWFIRGRHFLINEFKSYVNSEYIHGCPGNFEFGTTEGIANRDLRFVIESCFKHPFSKPPATEDEPPDPRLSERRNIILVGHDIQQDINYFRKIGVLVENNRSIIDHMDSARMYQAFTQDPNPRKLGTILADFDMVGWHLHNAGNDAVYTMYAMLAICVKAASERNTDKEGKMAEEKVKMGEKASEELARERKEMDREGWDLNEGDGEVASRPSTMSSSGNTLYTMGGAVLDV